MLELLSNRRSTASAIAMGACSLVMAGCGTSSQQPQEVLAAPTPVFDCKGAGYYEDLAHPGMTIVELDVVNRAGDTLQARSADVKILDSSFKKTNIPVSGNKFEIKFPKRITGQLDITAIGAHNQRDYCGYMFYRSGN